MSKREEAAALLYERFILQDDVYVTQWKGEDKSGYKKVVDRNDNEIPLTFDEVMKHINGDKTLGIYQLKDDKIKTLCFDVDSKDREAAKQQTLLLARHIQSILGPKYFLVEDSGSKGFHVWVFFEPVVSAELGYRFGRWIYSEVETIEGVSIEVFPKQAAAYGGYGNLIKLPWGINLKNGARCVFVNSRFEPHEDQFETLKNINLLRVYDEDKFYKHFDIPPMEIPEYEAGDKFLCITNILQNGPKEGHRDIALHKGSAFLRQNGMPMEYARIILHEANSRSNAPVRDAEVDAKVESTYRNKYFVHPCRETGLDFYCKTECAMFEKKAALRGVTIEQLSRTVGRN